MMLPSLQLNSILKDKILYYVVIELSLVFSSSRPVIFDQNLLRAFAIHESSSKLS